MSRQTGGIFVAGSYVQSMSDKLIGKLFGALAVIALLSAGCGKSEEKKGDQTAQPAAAPKAPEDPAIAAARQLFNTRCMSCHGSKGKGDGPAAAAMNPKPRNYTSRKWQKSVTDEKIAETIRKGGAAMGLNPMMPAQQDLSDEQLAGLVKLIRSFAK